MSSELVERMEPVTAGELHRGMLPAQLSNSQLAEIAETVLGKRATAVIHNFIGSPMEQWRMTATATGPDCLSFEQLEDGKFTVKYFYAHPIRLVRNGEIRDITRIVFIDTVGKAAAFTSEGIAKGLGQLINIFGWGPYDPAISIRVVKSKTPNGHIYNIVPDVQG